MEIANFLESVTYGEKRPVMQVMLNTTYLKEIRIAFKPSQVMKEHTAKHPIVVAVVKGSINFKVHGENHLLTEGMVISLTPEVLHELEAIETSIVRLSMHKTTLLKNKTEE